MNVAIITPYFHPAVRGTAVTVRRIAKYLAGSGCRVHICSLDIDHAENVCASIREFAPELIHAFHGHLGGRVARLTAQEMGVPYIVTLTGSDVYEALEDSRREETHAALREAAALVVFDKCVKKKVADHFPSLAEKTFVIPQGVELPDKECSSPPVPMPEGAFIFFLPAGLRPVKDVLFALEPLAALYRSEPRLAFLLAGPVLDAGYAAEVMARMEQYPFAHYLGGVGHDSLGCLYRKADVVLNTSRFEGGMANSVLEAMAAGRPVLAADIEGNRSVVRDGVTGLLYRDGEDFREKALALLTDVDLGKRLGENGLRLAREEYRPEAEAQAYIRLYERIRERGL
ncbi:MAG TPA: GPMC system family 4 glycosyltransferase [Geobacteraceae bacterium]